MGWQGCASGFRGVFDVRGGPQDGDEGGRREQNRCRAQEGRQWSRTSVRRGSRRPSTVGDAVVPTGTLGRQYRGGAPLTQLAVRAAGDIDAGHALEEGGGILASLLVGRGHGQRRAGRGQLLGLDGGAEQPVVTDALEAAGQNMLQEASDEVLAVDQDGALAAVVVGANAQAHTLAIDADDALVGDGHAVRVARQVVQHHLGPGQRRLGVDHPVMTLELDQPSMSMSMSMNLDGKVSLDDHVR